MCQVSDAHMAKQCACSDKLLESHFAVHVLFSLQRLQANAKIRGFFSNFFFLVQLLWRSLKLPIKLFNLQETVSCKQLSALAACTNWVFSHSDLNLSKWRFHANMWHSILQTGIYICPNISTLTCIDKIKHTVHEIEYCDNISTQ